MTNQVPHSESSASTLYLQCPINHQNREIRLLSLLPGGFDDALKCDIHSVSLDTVGLKYETLSYAWGDATITAPIIVGGYPLDITTNLSSAFRHLRSSSRPLIIWTDAICIDQSNNIEKSEQINVMSDIYKLCSRVYLWLGSEGHLSSNPFTIFEFLHEDKHLSQTAVSETSKAELTAILESPWWSRVWTVQETVLPPSALVVYGHWSMPWDVLVRSVEVYIHHRNVCCRDEWDFGLYTLIATIRNFVGSIEMIRTNDLGTWDLSALHYMTVRLRLRLATNPKDKIIGLLGLIDRSSLPQGRSDLDYTHRTSTIYLKYFSIMLENDPSGLQCFLGSGFNSPHQSGLCLPSWVPNFAQAIGSGQSFSELARFGRYECYDASAGRGRDFCIDNAHLHVQGYTHDQIDSIHEINSPKSLWDVLKSLSGLGNITAREDYLRTLTGNLRLSLSKDGKIRLGRVEDWEKEVLTVDELSLVDEHVREQPLREDEDYDKKDDIKTIIRWQINERVFFLTKNNTMGLCEPGAEVGDQVCILYGGHVPFILRKSFVDSTATPEKQAYKYIGACYLQGFMNGEALQEPCFNPTNEEYFWFPGSHCCPEPEEEF